MESSRQWMNTQSWRAFLLLVCGLAIALPSHMASAQVDDSAESRARRSHVPRTSKTRTPAYDADAARQSTAIEKRKRATDLEALRKAQEELKRAQEEAERREQEAERQRKREGGSTRSKPMSPEERAKEESDREREELEGQIEELERRMEEERRRQRSLKQDADAARRPTAVEKKPSREPGQSVGSTGRQMKKR